MVGLGVHSALLTAASNLPPVQLTGATARHIMFGLVATPLSTWSWGMMGGVVWLAGGVVGVCGDVQ